MNRLNSFLFGLFIGAAVNKIMSSLFKQKYIPIGGTLESTGYPGKHMDKNIAKIGEPILSIYDEWFEKYGEKGGGDAT